MHARMLMGLSKATHDMQILYRSEEDLGGAFDHIPSLNDLDRALASFWEGAPCSVTEPLMGLEEFIDGVRSVEVMGLPGGFEIVAKFTNFHILPMLVPILQR